LTSMRPMRPAAPTTTNRISAIRRFLPKTTMRFDRLIET
jgi:hypothetical protein